MKFSVPFIIKIPRLQKNVSETFTAVVSIKKKVLTLKSCVLLDHKGIRGVGVLDTELMIQSGGRIIISDDFFWTCFEFAYKITLVVWNNTTILEIY